MEAAKKRAGRPKAVPRTRPLVLKDEADRVKLDVEIATSTASDDRGGDLEDRRFRATKGLPARRALAGAAPR